jgi:hypothetical protein
MTIAATQPSRFVRATRSFIAPLAATLLALLAPTGSPLRADEAGDREAQLKAGYLYNFAKFVEWPADAPPTLTFCFDGGASVYAMLMDGLDDKHIGERPLLARELGGADTLDGCDVLYIDARSGSAGRGQVADDRRLLTVSDLPGFSRETGIIELYEESNRLRFAINVANARRAGMRISSDLLQLATLVGEEQAP